MPRLFVAIELEPALRARLAAVARDLSRCGPGVKWVEEWNYHLTLKFLGEVPEDQVPALDEALGGAAAGAGPFILSIGRLGAFPGRGNPRVIWAGVTGGVAECLHLQKRVEEAVARLGFAREERSFSPHLTLGRIKQALPPGLAGRIRAGQEQAFGDSAVNDITLMESRLTPGGPLYSARGRYRLGTDGAKVGAC